ncbi:MAG TPA: PHP domain-containing protein [Patescibacteria group bacterium]|nr:PHP domain-containing protein [Patescibacteria group bacterium]
MTNLEIAELLRKVAAAYLILNENRFKIIAYERAADSVEHLTSEVKDLWNDGKLKEIPGVGETLQKHLDELFRTGHVRHFEEVLGKLPASIYPLLLVPGIGPKKAYKLVSELKLNKAQTVIEDLEKAAVGHKIAPMEGFGEKSEADILANIETYKKGAIKENRMVLSEADQVALDVINFVKAGGGVKHIDTLGSLRRQVSTIGDIDISVATTEPETVIERFITYPHQKLIEKGPTGASLLLHNGKQVDLRVQKPEAYGAMLQYFTGSKNHNIKLRSLALNQGKSLNEYGIKNTKTNKLSEYPTEKAFYEAIKLPWIPPELREDRGEIEAAIHGKLPHLVELPDIRGDLHIHSSYDLESSHDVGAQSADLYLSEAARLGYDYVGFSDHNPSVGNHTEEQIVEIMKRRKDDYEHKYYSWVQKVLKTRTPLRKASAGLPQMFLMCEVDILPDGKLALPDSAFDYVDAVVVSVHSSFNQSREVMTRRVVTALTSHEKVRIFGHPTTRLLGKREGVEYDWDLIFEACKKQNIALEINAHPSRLDLPDNIVYDAKKQNLRFSIDTDAHAVDQMILMKYGVSVARRGWATKHDIVNSQEYNDFKDWLVKGAKP